MTSIRVEPDSGPPVTFLAGGSQLTEADEPGAVLQAVVDRLRIENRRAPAREVSLAITHTEEAIHWLVALKTRR